MNRFLIATLVVTITCLPLLTHANNGVENNDIVRDARGNPVRSMLSGTCVKTKWQNYGRNACECVGNYQVPSDLEPVSATARYDMDRAHKAHKREVLRNNGGQRCAPPYAMQPIAALPPVEEPPFWRIQEAVHFDFNSSKLTAETQQYLVNLADLLKTSGTVSYVHITGHADKIGEEKYNDRLSNKRADKVVAFLKKQGFDYPTQVVESKGEAYPISHCDVTLPKDQLVACVAKDRRVDIDIIYTTQQTIPAAAPAAQGW